jgi:hypothetical protein
VARRRLDTHGSETARADGRAATATAPHTALLALQRSAGNAAVSALLARKRAIPEDADTLEDVSSAAPEMIIDTTEMKVGAVKDWVTSARGSDRKGLSVDIRIAEPMASQPKVNKALTAMAMAFFNLREGIKKAAQLDTVKLVDVDFSPFGGADGHFRFTCVTAKPAGRGTDAQVDMIIELVHDAPADFTPWSQLDRTRKLALENAFSKHGFVKAEPTFTDAESVEQWLPEQWGQVLQALEKIPKDALGAVPGVRWVRGHGDKGPTGEGGHFDWDSKGTRKLTLYDGAFKGSDEGLVALIAHELGHALSAKPQTEKKGGTVANSTAWKAAVRADGGKAITDYGTTDPEESYADAYSMFVTEPETMKVLRPKQFEFFTKNPSGQPAP